MQVLYKSDVDSLLPVVGFREAAIAHVVACQRPSNGLVVHKGFQGMLQKKRKKKKKQQQQQQPGLMMRDELAMKTKEGSALTTRVFASFFEGLGFFLLLKFSQITTANTTYRVTRLCCCNAERKLGLQAKHGLHAAANSGGEGIDSSHFFLCNDTQTLALIWIKPSFFLFEDNVRVSECLSLMQTNMCNTLDWTIKGLLDVMLRDEGCKDYVKSWACMVRCFLSGVVIWVDDVACYP